MATQNDFSDSQINAGDEVFDLYCTQCSGRNVHRQASKYCLNCKEYYCVICEKTHNSFKALSGHSLVDPNKLKSTPALLAKTFHAVPTEQCKKHPLEVVNMYCRTDDSVGCSICFTLDHKSCDDTHYIPEYVQSNFPSEQVRQIKHYLTKELKTINKLKNQHDELNDTLDKSKAACRREILKYRKEINHIIDKIEEATLEQLDVRCEDLRNMADEMNQNIQYIQDEMMRFKAELVSDRSNDSQKFVIAKLSQSIMMQGRELESMTVRDQGTDLIFTRNQDIMATLLSFVALGILTPPKGHVAPSLSTTSSKLSKQTKCTDAPSASGVSRQNKKASTRQGDSAVAMTSHKQGLHKLEKKSVYNIIQAEDMQKCGVTSLCILDDMNIILADYSNNNLKLVDSTTYEIRSSLVLDASPNSVCRVSGTEVAVCLDNDTVQTVQVSASDGLEPLQALSMNHYCNCITVIKNRKFISDNNSMYIYGKVVKTIDKDKSGDDMFSFINDIAVSDDEKMIHIADRDFGVITINVEKRNIVWQYSGTELRRPYGVCTDGQGNVIVGGLLSHNIIQLGPDGRYIGEIATHSEKAPLSLSFDKYHKKLIVGKNNNFITVFTIK